MHRTLFGARPDVNVRPRSGSSLPARNLDRAALELIQYDEQAVGSSRSRALDALLESGRGVFVQRGYHNTRVDDLAAAAGVSHGVFYRYFANKGELARVLTARALQSIGSTLVELPDVVAPEDPARSAAVRQWLRRYNAAHLNEAAMLRVWIDGALQDRTLTPEFAAPLEWGRRRLSRYLRARAFGDAGGDVEMDAVVLVALLGVFGPRPRAAAEVDAAAHIIERGLFGR
jgi:AcrR family transcriptional regulator